MHRSQRQGMVAFKIKLLLSLIDNFVILQRKRFRMFDQFSVRLLSGCGFQSRCNHLVQGVLLKETNDMNWVICLKEGEKYNSE